VRGGFLHEVSLKTFIKGSAGIGSYDFGNKSPLGQDLNTDTFSFDFAATWQATDKILVEAMARNDIQPSVQDSDNAMEITRASMGASYDIAKSWTLSLAGSWRLDDYMGKVQDLDNRYRYKQRTLSAGSFRLDYKPNVRFLDVYAETTYENSDTNRGR